MLASDMLDLPASRSPDGIAVIDGKRRVTFADLADDTVRFANALLEAGIGKGDKIAVMLPNVAEYPVIHFGTARAGVVLAHLSYRLVARDIVYVLNKIGAVALVYHAEFRQLIEPLLNDVPSIRNVLVVEEPGHGTGDADDFAAFIAGRSLEAPAVSIAETDPIAINFTGGTTGVPKAVVVSHRSRTVSAVTILAQHGLSDADRIAVVTPLFHTAGLFVWFQPLIWLGCTCSLLRTWDPVEFMTLVERDRISAVFLVPTQLNGLVRHPRFDVTKLASLRHIGFAGAPMPTALIAELRDLFPDVAFTENYGQSETGPMTIKRHWEHGDHPDSVGRPVFNVSVDIVAADGRSVGPGEVGEIVTQGDHLLIEYFGEPDQTAALYRNDDKWLWTGDLGYRDRDGFITLVDRSKDMIISGGENIYPKEIEDVLYSHASVEECAVFGVPDDHWGEVPAAHVVLRNGVETGAEELIEFCVEFVARYKRPRFIEFVDQLPKSPVGKIQKHLIREPYWKTRERRI